MVKYLFLLAAFASQGFAQTDNEKSHILKCRAQRDALLVNVDRNDTTNQKNRQAHRSEGSAVTTEPAAAIGSVSHAPVSNPSSSDSSILNETNPREEPAPSLAVVELTNPTAQQRHLLNEPTFPGLKNRVFDSAAKSNESDKPEAEQVQRYRAIYEHKFEDGLLRPQLEALTTSLFPEFSVSWDNYHIPYRWQGEFLLKGNDRWALLNRVVESFGIGVTVNGNFVMEFNAVEEQ